MTTIVYDHSKHLIAFDSRVTEDGVILSDSFHKTRFKDGVTFFFAGDVADYDLVIEAYFNPEKQINKDLFNARALAVNNGVVYQVLARSNGYPYICRCSFNDAIGSGHQWALAALDYGASPREAVEYAATKDVYTGGKILVFDTVTGEYCDK